MIAVDKLQRCCSRGTRYRRCRSENRRNRVIWTPTVTTIRRDIQRGRGVVAARGVEVGRPRRILTVPPRRFGFPDPVGDCCALLLEQRPIPLLPVPQYGVPREAYLSTECPPPIEEARLPRPDEYPRWTRRPQIAARQRSRPSVRLTDRVRTRDEFVRLRRDGRRVRIDPFWCTHVTDPSAETSRVAFAINRAVGNAVTRNRLRRRLRAVLADLDLPPGTYLVGCRPRACELTFDQIRETLADLPSRIHVSSSRSA